MAVVTEKLPIICGGCGTTREVKPTARGQARLPRGWKRRPDPEGGPEAVLCADCWKMLFRLRAAQFPVAAVEEGGTWAEFCAAVRQSLFRSRTLAQWAVNQLAATDVARTLETERLPPHPPLGRADGVYLYGLASRSFADWCQWEGAYTAAQAVLRATELKYNEKRRAVVWEASEAVPTIRSQPYPVPAANWSAEYVEHEDEAGNKNRAPVVSLPLGGKRWLIRLRGGRQRARQLAAFRQIVSGAAEPCELAIYRKRSQASRDRSGMNGRTANGGGARVRYDIMVKLVAWLPRETGDGQKTREGVLSVWSTKNAFLKAVHPDFDRPWILNRHAVRGRIFHHARRLQQISEDTKCEVRKLPRPRGPWKKLTLEERRQRQALKQARRHRLDYLDKICRSYRDYVDTFIKEGAAWLAAYADRIGVAKVALDLSERDYCSGFTWAALRNRIAANLEDRGIELEAADNAVVEIVEENNGDGAGESSPSPDHEI